MRGNLPPSTANLNGEEKRSAAQICPTNPETIRIVTENVLITTAGIAAGVAMAIGLNQYLISKVELARLPLPYVVGGMLAVWALGVIAVLGPAWRAASVPPAIATRSA